MKETNFKTLLINLLEKNNQAIYVSNSGGYYLIDNITSPTNNVRNYYKKPLTMLQDISLDNYFWKGVKINKNINTSLLNSLLNNEENYIIEIQKIFQISDIIEYLVNQNDEKDKEKLTELLTLTKYNWKDQKELLFDMSKIKSIFEEDTYLNIIQVVTENNKNYFNSREQQFNLVSWLDIYIKPKYHHYFEKYTQQIDKNKAPLFQQAKVEPFVVKINKVELYSFVKLGDSTKHYNYQRMLECFESSLEAKRIQKLLGIESIGLLNKKVKYNEYMFIVEPSAEGSMNYVKFRDLLEKFITSYENLPKSGNKIQTEALKKLILNHKLLEELPRDGSVALPRTKI